MAGSVVLAEVVRSGFCEGRHHGSVVALAADGAVAWSAGEVDAPIFPRSVNKPLQAVGMLRAGLSLSGEPLALATSSHSGEPFHLEGVRRLLAGAGLDEGALQTPPDYPEDDEARRDWIRAGGGPTSLAMNCSGKHAAMLATCVVRGWDHESYLTPDHPLQAGLARTFADLTGAHADAVGVDGCGAPLLATSLTRLAGAFRRLALADTGAEHQVAQAVREFPHAVSGSRRDELRLLRALPGAIGKAGAEGCMAVALPDGRTVACKIDDGAARARSVVMAEALRLLGATDLPGADPEGLAEAGAHRLLGGGAPVGEVRPTLEQGRPTAS